MTTASEEAGWPDRAGDTALSIRIPEADALVRAGFPAHVTVLYPFLPIGEFDGAVHRELVRLFAAHERFELSFARFCRYPGVLFLAPDPPEPVRALTAALTARWPRALPYRGVFGPGLDPHLTVANHEGPETWEAAYDALEAELLPRLPVSTEVSEVGLIVHDGRAWRNRAAYGLGRRTP